MAVVIPDALIAAVTERKEIDVFVPADGQARVRSQDKFLPIRLSPY